MDLFHPLSNGKENFLQGKDVHQSIVSWARHEALYREINHNKSAARPDAPPGKSVDGSQKPLGAVAFKKGGIDLNTDKLDLQVRQSGGVITFNIDQAMLERLQGAAGFTPVIVDIRPEGLAQFTKGPAGARGGR